MAVPAPGHQAALAAAHIQQPVRRRLRPGVRLCIRQPRSGRRAAGGPGHRSQRSATWIACGAPVRAPSAQTPARSRQITCAPECAFSQSASVPVSRAGQHADRLPGGDVHQDGPVDMPLVRKSPLRVPRRHSGAMSVPVKPAKARGSQRTCGVPGAAAGGGDVPVPASFKIAIARRPGPAGQPITADPGRARTPEASGRQTRGRADGFQACRHRWSHDRSDARESACPGHVNDRDSRRSVADHVDITGPASPNPARRTYGSPAGNVRNGSSRYSITPDMAATRASSAAPGGRRAGPAPGCSARPGTSPLPGSCRRQPLLPAGNSRLGRDRSSRAFPDRGEILVVARAAGRDDSQAPHVQHLPEPLVSGRITGGQHSLLILAQELGTFLLRKTPEDHLRIARILL